MIEKLEAQINEYFVGKEEVVRKVLICLLAGGHVLLEDVPGTGKTTLARTLAASTSLSFGRIQFTPDTLPSDVVGVSIYDQKTQEFVFREGAVAKNLVLADGTRVDLLCEVRTAANEKPVLKMSASRPLEIKIISAAGELITEIGK